MDATNASKIDATTGDGKHLENHAKNIVFRCVILCKTAILSSKNEVWQGECGLRVPTDKEFSSFAYLRVPTDKGYKQ